MRSFLDFNLLGCSHLKKKKQNKKSSATKIENIFKTEVVLVMYFRRVRDRDLMLLWISQLLNWR